MKKIFLSLLVFLFVVVGIALLLKDMLAKAALIREVKAATGLEVGIRKVHIGIFKTSVSIEGLTISNPPGLADELLADIPEVYVDYDLPSLFIDTIHIRELRLIVQELHVVQDKDRKFNLGRVAFLAPKPLGAKSAQLAIDQLVLNIGRLVYKDYTREPTPKVLEYDLALHETFRNVTDPSKLAGQVIVKILARVNISDFLNLQSVKGKVPRGLQQVPAQVPEAAGSVKQGIEEVQGSAASTLNSASDDVKKLLGQ